MTTARVVVDDDERVSIVVDTPGGPERTAAVTRRTETTVDHTDTQQETDHTAHTVDQSREAVAITACSYSLAEVAAAYLPPEWKDGERWLSRRLTAGKINGYKVGRTWRMTDNDVEAFVDTHRKPKMANDRDTEATPSAAPTTVLDGLSPRSRAHIMRRT